MPKRPSRDKETRRPKRAAVDKIRSRPANVKALLGRLRLGGQALGAEREISSNWLNLIKNSVSQSLAEQVLDARFQRGTLTVFVSSAAWGARLRFDLEEVRPQLARHEVGLERIEVRVRGGPA